MAHGHNHDHEQETLYTKQFSITLVDEQGNENCLKFFDHDGKEEFGKITYFGTGQC